MRAEPDVRPEIEDRDHEPALEVVVQWGDSVLYAEHIRAPGELVLSEHVADGQARGPRAARSSMQHVSFAFDLTQLGVERLVLARHDGVTARLLVPIGLGARAFVEGVAVDAQQLGADSCVALPEGTAAQLELCGLVVHVRATRVARDASLRAVQPARLAQPWTLASLGAHLLVLALFYVLPPHSHALNVDDIDPRGRLVRFALEARSREPEPPLWTNEPGTEGEGAQGARAAGDEGASGDPKAPKAPRRAASRGDSPTPSLASTPIDAREEGILGLLRAAAPTLASRFDARAATGSDAEDALGALFGDRLGASFGFGGVGMIGKGRGGGGDSDGTVGLGLVGTFGVGTGKKGYGFGAAGDGLGPRKERLPPKLIPETPLVAGGLSKEVIRRVVHRHLAEVRHCYEQRLIARPDLQGRVAVRFVIGGSGVVAAAAVISSTVDDGSVALCIAQATRHWVFPAPDGAGVVSVTYPFVLQHAGR